MKKNITKLSTQKNDLSFIIIDKNISYKVFKINPIVNFFDYHLNLKHQLILPLILFYLVPKLNF